MKKLLLLVTLTLVSIFGFLNNINAQASRTLWETTMRYNCATGYYEVYGRATVDLKSTISPRVDYYLLASTITVVIPSGFPNRSLQLISDDFNEGYPRNTVDFSPNARAKTVYVNQPEAAYITIDNNNGGKLEDGSDPLFPDFSIKKDKEYFLF